MIEYFDFNDYYLEHFTPNTENIYMSENELFFDVKIPIKAVRKDKKTDEILNTDVKRNCYIGCKFLLNGEFSDFEITRVGDEPSVNRPFEVSIQVDSNLIPRDKKYPMYEDASELLNRLYTDDEIKIGDSIANNFGK